MPSTETSQQINAEESLQTQPLPAQPVSAKWDALIHKLSRSGDADLLIEHLQTAHAYLHGAMPLECSHNLELARQAADGLHDKQLQDEVRENITVVQKALDAARSLREQTTHRRRMSPAQSGAQAPVGQSPTPRLSMPHSATAPSAKPSAANSSAANSSEAQSPAGKSPTAKGLSEFFHGSDVSFGNFYPKKYIVAVFSSYDVAETGHQVLSTAGFGLEDIAVSGKEVGRFLENIRANRAPWEDFMTEVSRMLGTEAELVDNYRTWARRGAGFLIVNSPSEAAAETIVEFLKPLHPIAVQWFLSGAIRHMV